MEQTYIVLRDMTRSRTREPWGGSGIAVDAVGAPPSPGSTGLT